MANPVVARCPICSEQLRVVRLECESCGTRLEGSFSLGRFHALAPEQLEFLEVFIRARGSFKDVERELGISYPTVRARLDAVIRALGFPSQAEPDREARHAERAARREEWRSHRFTARGEGLHMQGLEIDGVGFKDFAKGFMKDFVSDATGDSYTEAVKGEFTFERMPRLRVRNI